MTDLDHLIKQCVACNFEKPLTMFPLGRNQCKSCRTTYRNELRHKDPEGSKIVRKRSYAKRRREDPEGLRERNRRVKEKWANENPEAAKESARRTYIKRRDRDPQAKKIIQGGGG